MTVIFENSRGRAYIRIMKRWGRFILIFVAYGIALLHTAVPHHHDSSSDRSTIITGVGCHFNHSSGGFLQMLFSTDLGYGHLEIFKKGADTRVDFSATGFAVMAVFATPVRVPAVASCAGSDYPFIDKLQRRLLLYSATRFRGPPVLA